MSLVTITTIANDRKDIVNPFTGYADGLCPDCLYQKQWIARIVSGPTVLYTSLFTSLLIYIVLVRLKHIVDIYLSVLVYALSQVGQYWGGGQELIA